jgi:hypothetical protein
MGAENNRLIVCQVALLFIRWSTSQDPKDGFHWSGIAINEALCLLLHKQLSVSTMPNLDLRFRKRLWWAVVMQEADVCLATGRPPRLTTCAAPDFDLYDAIDAIGMDTQPPSELLPMIQDSRQQQLLQMVSTEKAKLCLIALQLETHLHGADRSALSNEAQNARTWQLDALLHDWEHALPKELRYLMQSDDLDCPRNVRLALSMAVTIYLMALIMLHKSEVPGKQWSAATEEDLGSIMDDQTRWYQAHARSMRRAANNITKINMELYESNLAHVIPGMGVLTLCAAIGVYLLDARSFHANVRASSLAKIDRCLTVLRVVGNLNSTSLEITRLVESAVQEIRSAPEGSNQQDTTRSLRSQLPYPEINGGESGAGGSTRQDQMMEPTQTFPCSTHVEDFATSSWTDPFVALQMESFFNFDIDENAIYM